MKNQIVVFCFTAILLIAASCGTHQHTVAASPVTAPPQLLGEVSHGWLKYQFYIQHNAARIEKQVDQSHSKAPLVFSIRIVNAADNTSPLRRLCSNLDEYNSYYEYLLNETKNDLTLVCNGKVVYPIYYAFENNYNAFPFETIDVGYPYQKPQGKHGTAYLQYADKVFAHDTITCQLLAVSTTH